METTSKHQLVPQIVLESYTAGVLGDSLQAVGMFVDVSGFSAMTDALMEHGQHGAEVLAEVMRNAFEPLILAAYEQGGFVVMQMGDSFTALFPIDADNSDAARRSLAAAWTIQMRVASERIHVTPYGEFDFSVKVGLALGEASWGVVVSEDSKRASYYFSGESIDGCAACEGVAKPGDVILDAGVFDQVGNLVDVDSINGDEVDMGATYYRVKDIVGELPARESVTQPSLDLDTASLFFPRELLTQTFAGEFRMVTYLLVKVPTVRTEAQLRRFMETVFSLQERYGGLLKLQFGDKGAHLLLLWGAPEAHENDIQRALSFILDLQMQTAIPISAGVTHRRAHAGFIGSHLAEEYAAFGRGVNLAARFMTESPRGDVWVDENIFQRARNDFDLEYLEERSFKGFSQLQKVYLLFERLETTDRVYDGRLVGRQSEIDALRDFVKPLFSGQYVGGLVVWGETGIGKSRLIHEFLNELEADAEDSVQVFLAQSDEIMRTSFNPFRYWLQRHFELSDGQSEARNKRNFNRKIDSSITATEDTRLAEELDRTRSFLGALVGLEWPDSLYEQLDAESRYENTLTGLISLLQVESARRPLIFFLEDIHWLDDDSRVFLPHLVRAMTADERRQYPFALLLSSRYGEISLTQEDMEYEEIHLGKLETEALAGLVDAYLGGPPAPELLDLLERRTDGNPFFAEQLLRFMQDENLLMEMAQGWTLPEKGHMTMPDDLQAVLVARLDRLGVDVRQAVQTAAVLGREFDFNLLTQMSSDGPSLAQKVSAAESAGIWRLLGDDRYMFSNALLRDAAYRMQVHSRRLELHALAVEALESLGKERISFKYGELAYHAENAGLDDKTRLYLHLAGDEAQENYQNSQAIDYYSRAISLTPVDDHEALYELMLRREEVYEILGMIEERQVNLETIESLIANRDDDAKAARISFCKADYAYDTADFPTAIEFGEVAISQALSTGDLELAIKAHGLLASLQMRQNRFEEAVKHAEIGLELAREKGDQLNKGIMYNHLGLISLEQRDLAEARAYFERGLAIYQEGENLRTKAQLLNNLAMVAGYLGDYAAALANYEESLSITRQIGIRAGEGIVLGNLGWIAGTMGAYERAREYAEQNLVIARQIGNPYMETYGLINLSSYSGALMDYETALHCAEQGLALASQIGDQSAEAWSLTYAGHSYLALGQHVEATKAYKDAVEIRLKLEQPLLASEPAAGLAQTALESGEWEAALEHLGMILQHLEGGGSLEGIDDPFRVYMTCYLVLEKANDPRAVPILETAYSTLQERLVNMPDESARRAFLENISHNRQIVSAWERLSKKN